jgi:hypothetical protein
MLPCLEIGDSWGGEHIDRGAMHLVFPWRESVHVSGYCNRRVVSEETAVATVHVLKSITVASFFSQACQLVDGIIVLSICTSSCNNHCNYTWVELS